jgi:hypothetical protein
MDMLLLYSAPSSAQIPGSVGTNEHLQHLISRKTAFLAPISDAKFATVILSLTLSEATPSP